MASIWIRFKRLSQLGGVALVAVPDEVLLITLFGRAVGVARPLRLHYLCVQAGSTFVQGRRRRGSAGHRQAHDRRACDALCLIASPLVAIVPVGRPPVYRQTVGLVEVADLRSELGGVATGLGPTLLRQLDVLLLVKSQLVLALLCRVQLPQLVNRLEDLRTVGAICRAVVPPVLLIVLEHIRLVLEAIRCSFVVPLDVSLYMVHPSLTEELGTGFACLQIKSGYGGRYQGLGFLEAIV